MIKNTSNTTKLNLYRKEQIAIGILLLCFAVLGFLLPSLDNTDRSQDESQEVIIGENISVPSDTTVDTTDDASTITAKPKSSKAKPKPVPGKTWVPPVYEIVHHEAVYETRRVIVCNYCSAEFASVGAFQVHKDANGG